MKEARRVPRHTRTTGRHIDIPDNRRFAGAEDSRLRVRRGAGIAQPILVVQVDAAIRARVRIDDIDGVKRPQTDFQYLHVQIGGGEISSAAKVPNSKN